MTEYAPEDGKWQIGENATLLAELRSRMSPVEYEADKLALKIFLCNYFSSGGCDNAQGASISPVKATRAAAKY